MKKICFTLCLLLASSLPVQAINNGRWIKEEAGWAYYNTENLRLYGWLQDEYQCWYLLDYNSGIMKTGWAAENDDWYYFNPDNGIMQDSKWIYENDAAYYLLPNGKMAVGIVEIDGIVQEFSSTGIYIGEALLPEDPSVPELERMQDIERQLAAEVVDQVNRYREEAGLAPLDDKSSALLNAADLRVHELAESFGHDRPDGRYFASVLDEVGISTYYYAENIAFEYQTAEEAMTFWMHSDTHRSNIMNDRFTEIAVSVIPSATGYLWEMICVGE